MPRTNQKTRTIPPRLCPPRPNIGFPSIRRPALGEMAADPKKTPGKTPQLTTETPGATNVDAEKLGVQMEDKMSKLNDKVLAKYQLKYDEKAILDECREQMKTDLKALGVGSKSEGIIKYEHEILLGTEVKRNELSEARGYALLKIEEQMPAGLESKTIEWLVKPNKISGKRKLPGTITQISLKDDLSFVKAIEEFKGKKDLATMKLSIFVATY